ncbi:MAG TPA: ABC transporter permease subunit [Vicinamibacterales bacterium]|nr:ABC transporter permease subunit [Vicinamibacterales bacterium]
MIALLARSAYQIRFALIATVLVLGGLQVLIIAQAVEIQRASSFSSMANLLPGFLQRGLGSKALILATFKGTVSFGYFHPIVCMTIAVMAMYPATEIAHEVEAGLVDLELARAVPRHRLVTRSLLLAHLTAALVLLVMAAGTVIGVRLFDAAQLDVPAADLRARLLFNQFAVTSCFTGFALLVASRSRRWSTAFTIAALTAVVLYNVDFIALGWRPMEVIAWLSPFHYFPALSVIAGDAETPRNVTILFIASAVLSAAAYWQFQRRDL